MTTTTIVHEIVFQPVDCARCGGAGSLSEDVADMRGEHDTRETPCEACDGTGEARCEHLACGEPATTDHQEAGFLCDKHRAQLDDEVEGGQVSSW